MRIGIFSTFADQEALALVNAVQNSVRTGEIPDSEITFVFSNREPGENPVTDRILLDFVGRGSPPIILSAARFEPEERRNARSAEKEGHPDEMNGWRNRFGMVALGILPKTDVDLLLGDMWIWGKNLAQARNGVNLHPALPTGPKGEWHKVIWDLIEEEADETGLMMHKVTKDLDQGPPVSFAQFPIRGPQFDHLWGQLPVDPEQRQLLISRERELRWETKHPFHREIRRHGFAREIPLVIQTTKALAEGGIGIEGAPIDLTDTIDAIAIPQLEGAMGRRKEVRV